MCDNDDNFYAGSWAESLGLPADLLIELVREESAVVKGDVSCLSPELEAEYGLLFQFR